jgi:hypothetical protein
MRELIIALELGAAERVAKRDAGIVSIGNMGILFVLIVVFCV